jgi:hypothetical protein
MSPSFGSPPGLLPGNPEGWISMSSRESHVIHRCIFGKYGTSNGILQTR